MKHLISKDLKRRNSFKKNEHKKNVLLSLYRNEKISPSFRFLLQTQLFSLIKGSKTRVRNRCLLSGRSHSVLRYFKLSRIQFRLFALSGFLPGVQKASW